MTPVPIEDEAIRAELKDAALQFSELLHRVGALEREVSWLRRRLASFHPERSYCPKCKAILHPAATSCKCGASWGPRIDPKAGLPT